ncbi:hypothetical protein ABBQ38_007953 [Trebouxia sp. C0009 RCD-2024]
MHQGSTARPQGIRPQPPCPSPRADQPFRPIRILTHANSGRLNSRGAGQSDTQEPLQAEDMPCSPAGTPPGLGHPCRFASLPRLKTSGSAPLEDDFWCSSPCDHVVHPFLLKKNNPFGAVSSPNAGTPTSGQGPFADSPRGVDSPSGVNHRRHSGQGDWTNEREGFLPQPALYHDQGLR